MKIETHFVYFRGWGEREQEEASTFTKSKPFTQHCRIDSLSFFDFLDKRVFSHECSFKAKQCHELKFEVTAQVPHSQAALEHF